MKRYIFTMLLYMVAICSFAQERLNVGRTFISSEGFSLPYQVIWPDNYDPGRSYPLLLFLHGAGERGNDNIVQFNHGHKLLLENDLLRGGAIKACLVFRQYCCASVSRDKR